MDRDTRHSSLPTSLIPHLYVAPRDSSTRTTLTSHSTERTEQQDQRSYPSRSPLALAPLILPTSHSTAFIHRSSSYPFADNDRQLPPVLPANHIHRPKEPNSSLTLTSSNIHRPVTPYTNQSLSFPSLRHARSSPNSTLLPPLASFSPHIFPSWREGEAGPSSLIHPGQRDHASNQNRRGSSQPARIVSHPHPYLNYPSSSRELLRQDAGYYSSFSSPLNQSLYGSANSSIPPLPPLQNLNSLEPPLSFDRRDAYSYPQVGSLSISGSSPPNYLTQVNNSPDLEQSYRSESHSADIEGDDAHKDKKRRAHSMDTDDNPKKAVRKTAVACNFCRGRKLRCNGAKPSCYNCTVRKFECEYVSTQRRRGPGKAPKGSRSRKGRSENSGSSSKNLGDRLSTMVPDYELSPDLQPFTSVITLEKFEFQLPNTSPQYPSDRHESLMR